MLPKEILRQVADEYNISPSQVELLYLEWWRYINKFVSELDLSKWREYEATDINIPEIGRLKLNFKKIKKVYET